jgi:hypothetical protein
MVEKEAPKEFPDVQIHTILVITRMAAINMPVP